MPKSVNIQEVAELSAAINTTWREQAQVLTATTTTPPTAGRRVTVVFPVLPGVGNSISVGIDGSTVTWTYDGTFNGITDLIRALAGVYACVVRAAATYESWRCQDPTGTIPTADQTGAGFEIVFEEGAASIVTLAVGSIPAGTVLADTTEGISVASALRALVHLPVADTQAEIEVNTDQILLRATGAYRGTAGNALDFEVVVAGALTPLSIVVVGTTITINSETDAGVNPVSTVEEVLLALQRSEDVLSLCDVEQGSAYVAVQIIAAEIITNLAAGANGSINGDLWAMLDDADGGGDGNHWVLVTPTAISGALAEDTVERVDCSEYAYLYWQSTAVTGTYTPRIGLCGGAV